MNNKKYPHIYSNRTVAKSKLTENKLRAENKRLQSEIAKIKQRCADMEEQAIHDPLTGVFNRRRVESMLAANTIEQKQSTPPVSVVMLDMDNLKKINDTFGHAIGDLALRILGEKLRQMTRPEDIVCRYGGDEFIVFLHNVNSETAYKRAEEWRQSMAENPILRQNQQIHITITVGIANYTEHGDTLAKAIEAADEALYWAKSMGRNCTAMVNDVSQTLYVFPYDLLANKDFANVESGFYN